jgi:hypothetical protein
MQGYKSWQRRAVVLSLLAKKAGVNLDWVLTADYKTLTEKLNELMKEQEMGT